MTASAPWAALLKHRQALLAGTAVVAVLAATVAVRTATRDDQGGGARASTGQAQELVTDSGTDPSQDPAAAAAPGVAAPGASGATAGPGGVEPGSAATAPDSAGRGGPAAPSVRGGAAAPGTSTPLPGVTDKEIEVVYYWKGDRTRTSPYLTGSGAEANVDEAEAFRRLVAYINDNADGGGTLMGHPINLHGRRLKPVVVEAGQDAESFAATAERITRELKPMAAVAAHGSISAYLCPALAKAGIHNLATYDLAGGLASRTNGYCLPSGMTWERQVDLSEAFLLRQQRAESERVYGIVYAEYPGLVDSAPKMVTRYKRAGLNVAAVASVSASLTTAQQQAPNVVAQMRAKGVNTIVMPDAGAPINFTHSAQAQGYSPDYYVWPCSGQDTMGMVRILNAAQWARASGLTCYDQAFASDVTNNDQMRRTEWYRAYRSQQDAEPPAPTPFVYAALLPLVVGVSGAGPDLTLESYRAALDGFRSYRYDAVDGRSDDGTNMLLGPGTRGRGLLEDAIALRYNATRREPGSSAPGAYDFPERRRYATRADFR
jgi:hypothetical protein